MPGLLDGKTALVTGGGTGIGRAIAERFAREGAQVAICGRREATLRAAAEALAEAQLAVAYRTANVADGGSVKALAEWLRAEFGRVDIVVNNAGVFRHGGLAACREADWDLQLAVNLKGPYLVSRALLPLMPAGGVILNVASTLGLRAMRDAAAYCAAKGGLVNLTRAMALDLAPRIRVNALCPAVVATPLVEQRIADGTADRAALEAVQPLGRMGRAEEVAAMALHLCGPEAAWTTGSIVVVDGGATAR